MSLQILNLQADNYKRLKAVDITPSGNVVFIGGRNAQGKTSVLDAIWAALAGGDASRATSQPIRDGQDTAVVRLDLGEYVVTRRWTKDDAGTLTVESGDGAKYSSPQKMLDELIGARAFDPLAFTRMSARDQVTALVATVDLPFDPAELDRERKGVFDSRTEIGREVTKLEGQLAGFPPADASLPADEVSAADILAEHEKAREHNAQIQKSTDLADELDHNIEGYESQIADLESRLSIAKRGRDGAREAAAASKPINTDEITARLSTLEETNAKVRAQNMRVAVAAELADRKAAAARFKIKLSEIDKRKTDALAAVTFPIENLSFDEDGVTYNKIPFSQASAAEQLRVSVALAMAANPTLRVLRILDGSLLDTDSLKLIAEMATAHDYQVWIEVVDESGKVGIVMEDGEVRA